MSVDGGQISSWIPNCPGRGKRRNNGGSVYEVRHPRGTGIYSRKVYTGGSARGVSARVPDLQRGRFGQFPLPADPGLLLVSPGQDEVGAARGRLGQHSPSPSPGPGTVIPAGSVRYRSPPGPALSSL